MAKPSTLYTRFVGLNEKKLPSNVNVRYLYQPGELEGGTKRATDPIWSLKVYTLKKGLSPNQMSLFFTICMMVLSVGLYAKSC